MPDEPGQHQSPAARNRRLVRNFVRRNLTALEQPAFREGAGPGIVIPNAIILNWVCWWVATKDEDLVHAELIEERLRLWELLWGDSTGKPGYLDELDDEFRQLVLDRFDEQHFEAVMVASIGDVWASITEATDPEYRRLRSVLRSAVCHPCWQVTAVHMGEAAVLTNGRPTTLYATSAADLGTRLWEIACFAHNDHDVQVALATVVGASPDSMVLTKELVNVEGSNTTRLVDQVSVDVSMTSEIACQVLAAWLGTEDLTFYRLKWPGGVAFYNAEKDAGWIVPDEGDEIELNQLAPSSAPWRVEIDRLCEAVDARDQAAA